MKLIKGVCFGQNLSEIGRFFFKKSKKLISTEHSGYVIIMKNIDLCVPPDKLNSWWVTKNMQEKNILFSFDRRHELRKFRAWLSLLWFWNVASNAWNGSRVLPSAVQQLSSSQLHHLIDHTESGLSWDESLGNAPVYSSICEQNIVFFKNKLFILLWSKSCSMFCFNYWFNHGFSVKRLFLSLSIYHAMCCTHFFKNTSLSQAGMFYQILNHWLGAWSALGLYFSLHNTTKITFSCESKSTEMSVRFFCCCSLFFFSSHIDFFQIHMLAVSFTTMEDYKVDLKLNLNFSIFKIMFIILQWQDQQ